MTDPDVDGGGHVALIGGGEQRDVLVVAGGGDVLADGLPEAQSGVVAGADDVVQFALSRAAWDARKTESR